MSDFITLKTDDSYKMDVTVNIHQIACIIGYTIQLSTGQAFKLTSKSLEELYDRIGE